MIILSGGRADKSQYVNQFINVIMKKVLHMKVHQRNKHICTLAHAHTHTLGRIVSFPQKGIG